MDSSSYVASDTSHNLHRVDAALGSLTDFLRTLAETNAALPCAPVIDKLEEAAQALQTLIEAVNAPSTASDELSPAQAGLNSMLRQLLPPLFVAAGIPVPDTLEISLTG